MTSNVLQDKGFRNESDGVAIAAKIMISRIRKHVEEDGCKCCKEALLQDDYNKKRAGSSNHQCQPPKQTIHKAHQRKHWGVIVNVI